MIQGAQIQWSEVLFLEILVHSGEISSSLAYIFITARCNESIHLKSQLSDSPP